MNWWATCLKQRHGFLLCLFWQLLSDVWHRVASVVKTKAIWWATAWTDVIEWSKIILSFIIFIYLIIYIYLLISCYFFFPVCVFLNDVKCVFLILGSWIDRNHVETNLLQPTPTLCPAEFEYSFTSFYALHNLTVGDTWQNHADELAGVGMEEPSLLHFDWPTPREVRGQDLLLWLRQNQTYKRHTNGKWLDFPEIPQFFFHFDTVLSILGGLSLSLFGDDSRVYWLGLASRIGSMKLLISPLLLANEPHSLHYQYFSL